MSVIELNFPYCGNNELVTETNGNNLQNKIYYGPVKNHDTQEENA
jgi:hypothetical protein